MRKLVLGVLAAALLIAAPAAAQEQRGSIQGVVKDSSGGVLPGVTVEARSPALVGVQTAVSDTNGVYRFPALAPGNYTVTATLQGFGPAKAENIKLDVGATLKIDLTMAVAGVSVSETVKGEPPLIDVKANAATATVSSDIIDLIPKGRNFTSVLTQIPGTNNEGRGGGIMIDGSSGSENRYVIDGMDTTNLRTGVSQKDVITDFISTVTVKQSGYNAEYRAATGGVISAITKSGSNVFHGDAGTYYTSNAFLGRNRQTLRTVPTDASKAEYVVIPRTDGTYTVDPVFDVGGPVFRDKLWFFAGYNPSYNRSRRTVTWSNPGAFAKTQTFNNGSPYDRTTNYNLTSQITKDLRGRFTGSNERQRGGLGLPGSIQPDGTSTANPSTFNPRSTVRSDSFVDSYTADLDYVASSKLYLHAQGGYFGYGSHNAGGDYFQGIRRSFSTTNVKLLDVPAAFQQPSGYADNIANSWAAKDNYSRFNINADATWFGRWKGDHAVKVGLLFERLGNDVNTGQQFPNIALSWDASRATLSGTSVRGKYGYYTVQQQYTIGNIHSNSMGVFAQDAWTINNKLTVNYGVRIEHEDVPSYRPENPGITFGWGDKIAPRLGFAYDIKGDSRWKAYGSYGQFYDTFKLELPRGAWGADHWIAYYYTLDDFNWPAINCDGVPGHQPACPGTFIEQVDFRHVSNGTGAENLVDPNLKPVKTGEMTLGLDHELNRVTSIGLRYSHKWMVRTIEDVGVQVPGVGEVFYIANPGDGLGAFPLQGYPRTPHPQRDYDGVEVMLRKRLSNHWQATTSFLVSRLYGTYSGLASSDENGRTSPNVNRFYDGLYMSFDQKGDVIRGRLQTDRPFQFKAQASYVFKWGTQVGFNFLAESGVLQTTQVTYQGVPVDVFGRGDLGRAPMFNQTDLLIGHEVGLGHGMRATFQINVTNLFDQATWTALGTSAYRDALVIPATAGSTPASLFFAPGGFNTVALQAARLPGSGRPSPTYRLPSSFQGERSIRLFAKFTF